MTWKMTRRPSANCQEGVLRFFHTPPFGFTKRTELATHGGFSHSKRKGS
jgi:hypothetical protein